MHIASLITLMGFLVAVPPPGGDAYLTARHAERSGKYGDAVSSYATCVAAGGPLVPYAKARAAYCRAVAGDFGGAMAEYQAFVSDASQGPWTRMAQAEQAFLLAQRLRNQEAAALYAQVLAVQPRRWWLNRYAALAAENLITTPEMAAEGYAYFREVVETTRRRAARLQAAQGLARSPSVEDRFIAAAALIRSAEYKSAGMVLTGLLVAAGGEYQPRWSCLFGRVLLNTGQGAQGRGLLQQALEAQPETKWGRLALAHLARSYVSAEEAEAARAAFDRLVAEYPDTEETGDALWWLAERLAGAAQPRAAVEQYLLLAKSCPSHERADDARMAAGRLLGSLGEGERAAAAFKDVTEHHADSPFYAEACYSSGQLRVAAGDAQGALEAFNRAARNGLGNYYAHRAWEQAAALGDTKAAACVNLKVDGEQSYVRPFPSTPIPHTPNYADLLEDVRFQRLRFFGLNGLEEAEWEALDLTGPSLRTDPNAWAIYSFLVECGLAHTARETMEANAWGMEQGLPSAERQHILFPRAYWPLILQAAKETGVDPFLVAAAALQESTFRPNLTSHAGAQGVMQVMPATAKWLAAVEPNLTSQEAERLDDPTSSFRLGAYYLLRMIERSDGNLAYALAAYNAGPGNLKKWRAAASPDIDLETFVETIPFAETKDYVKKVLGNYAAYRTLYPAQ